MGSCRYPFCRIFRRNGIDEVLQGHATQLRHQRKDGRIGFCASKSLREVGTKARHMGRSRLPPLLRTAGFDHHGKKEPCPPRVKQQPREFVRELRIGFGMPCTVVGMLKQAGQQIGPARKIVGQVRLAHAGRPRNLGLGQRGKPVGVDDGLGRIENAPSDIAAQPKLPYACRWSTVPM